MHNISSETTGVFFTPSDDASMGTSGVTEHGFYATRGETRCKAKPLTSQSDDIHTSMINRLITS